MSYVESLTLHKKSPVSSPVNFGNGQSARPRLESRHYIFELSSITILLLPFATLFSVVVNGCMVVSLEDEVKFVIVIMWLLLGADAPENRAQKNP